MSQLSAMMNVSPSPSQHLRHPSAASIFSHYIHPNEENEPPPLEEKKDTKKKCRCCRKCCWRRRTCFGCFRRRKGSSVSKRSSINAWESGDDLSYDEERPPQGWCGLFRRQKRKSAQVREEEDWEEDMGKVENVTSGFKDWLAHTYQSDKKAHPKIRRQRIKARRDWARSTVVTLMPPRGEESIISLKGLTEAQLDQINDILMDIALWEFNTFDLDEKTTCRSLSFVTREVFRTQDFLGKFRIKSSAFKNLLKALEAGYTMHGNPYHNQRHAADVVQTVHSILTSHPGISHKFTDLEHFGLIFAAVVHDLAHPGTTNNFHINAQTNLALLYNDKSVLENHHVASAFQILKNNSCNILENISNQEYKEFRELVIELVLGTDMVNHFQHIKTIRGCLKQREWNGASHKTITATLSLILHAADISNPAKPWLLHKRSTELVYAEYLAQGIQEQNLRIPVSPLCDPKDQNAATQITFIEVIVQPTFQVMGDLFDLILALDCELADSTELIVSQMPRKSIRGRATIAKLSGETLLPPSKPGRFGSIIATPAAFRGIRNSKTIDENRPWLTHLAINIGEWRKIQEAEAQAQRKKMPSLMSTPKLQPNFTLQLTRNSAKPNQVAPAP